MFSENNDAENKPSVVKNGEIRVFDHVLAFQPGAFFILCPLTHTGREDLLLVHTSLTASFIASFLRVSTLLLYQMICPFF